MNNKDKSFSPENGLEHAVNLLREVFLEQDELPDTCPDLGIGELDTLNLLAPHVLGRAAHLGRPVC